MTALRRVTGLSEAQEADYSIRKLCNTAKRMSSLLEASVATGAKPTDLLGITERLAFGMLKAAGFDIRDEQRVRSVMPLMAEAAGTVLAGALRHGQGELGGKPLEEYAAMVAVALAELTKSRLVSRMIEPAWELGSSEATSMRLSVAAAMSHVAQEIAEFDFMHPMHECLKESSKVVANAAFAAAAKLADAKCSSGARMMLTQSLLASASKVFASVWRVEAANQSARLDAMPDAERELELQRMESTPVAQLMRPLVSRFEAAFEQVVDLSMAYTEQENKVQRKALGLR